MPWFGLLHTALHCQGWKLGRHCVNPLPLLTACGNGQGGGDFFKGNICTYKAWTQEIVGSLQQYINNSIIVI